MDQKDEKQWTKSLMSMVNKEGGFLDNGWEVKIKRRTNGAIQITCKRIPYIFMLSLPIFAV
jgi:hypothetical protein